MCGVFALISPFTVSNFGAISLVRFLLCCWLFSLQFCTGCGCQSSATESSANLKLVKIG